MKPVLINHQLNMESLWNGCILASIAHAIMVAHYPELSYEHSWDGDHYCVVDSEGGRGTITFKGESFIAAFRTEELERNDVVSAFDFFHDAPREILELAKEETLQYLLEEHEDGLISPSVTTAFWGDHNGIFSADNIVKIVQYGGYLLERQLMDFDSAIESWQEYYQMTAEQADLLISLYTRKINSHDSIILTKEEINIIGPESPEGLNESITSFKEIDIYWER